jgi:soluble lytic murein transglycosylase-like protein
VNFQRRRLAATLAGLLPMPALVCAGEQQYEHLADDVRSALASQIADRTPPRRRFAGPAAQAAYDHWFAHMEQRLEGRLPSARLRADLLQCLDYEATRAGLDRQLVLGLIEVESNFRKYAISSAGARGLMQVMPFWVGLIGDRDPRKLFEMRTNLRYGCVILRHYVKQEQGDLFRALGRYNGSLGQAAYPDAVRAAWQRHWAYEST